jgi:hypothetical protein
VLGDRNSYGDTPHLIYDKIYTKYHLWLAGGSSRVGATHAVPYHRKLKTAIRVFIEN